MRVLLSNPGTQHSFHLARELDRRGILSCFYTGAAFRPGALTSASRYLPRSLRKAWSARALPQGFTAKVSTKPFIELQALWRLRRGANEQEVLQRRNDAFQRAVPETALANVDVVIGADTASAILAEKCRRVHRPFVLDQTIGHPDAKQRMHDAMRQRFPDWKEGFETRLPYVRDAELQEQALATRIVTACSFTRATLMESGVARENIAVIPYGVDTRRFQARDESNRGTFRFVFAGLITARKGVPLLIEAWKRLSAMGAELWLIGPASPVARRLIPSLPGLRYLGAVPQADMPRLLNQCDAFVFPSFFEGFGLVLLEAMACGLPVISTNSTAAPDIVTENSDGWIIEPGNLDALISRMTWCLENPHEARAMRSSARQTAQGFSWSRYGESWAQAVEQLCKAS